MKQRFALVTLSGILTCSTALAQEPAIATEAPQAQAVNVEMIDAQLDEAIATLEEKALARQATDEEYSRVQAHIERRARALQGTLPEERDLADRLSRSVSSLQRRAKNAALTKQDFAALRGQVIDTRTDRALILLEKKAAARGATPEDIAQLSDLVRARAENSKASAGDTSNLRTQYMGIMKGLQTRTQNASVSIAEVREVRSQLIDARLDDALGSLENAALARSAATEDFQRVKDHVNDRANLMKASVNANPQAETLRTKTMLALDQLQQRAKTGELSREDFQTLRTQMVQRAQNAAGAQRGAQQNASQQGAERKAEGQKTGADGQKAPTREELKERALNADGTKAQERAKNAEAVEGAKQRAAGAEKKAGEKAEGVKKDAEGLKREGAKGEKQAGDVRKKADDAKQKAGDVKKKTDDPRKKAGDVKKKTDDARKKAGDVKKKTDDARGGDGF